MALKPNPSALPRSITFFASLASFCLLVGLLMFAKSVLIPIALAVLLTFLLGPIIGRLQKLGLSKIAAIMFVMVMVCITLGTVGAVVTNQVVTLARELADNKTRERVLGKVETMKREWGGEGAFTRITGLFSAIREKIEEDAPVLTTPEPPPMLRRPDLPADELNGNGPKPKKEPVNVTVVAEEDKLTGKINDVVGPLIEPLANAGLVVVLVIFMLLKREDLRNRLVTLSGRTHLAVTTKALDEAGKRISRYLLMQFLINMGYGLAVTLGLFALRIEYAVLWGSAAAVLRYIPYVGPWVAAILPIGYSVLESAGWAQPAGVVVLILVLEVVVNNVLEPWLYGRNVGVSEVAVILSAVFWGWLWGPIGLVLATPMTVCLVVAGRYVPALSFLDRLLGDDPEVAPHIVYYQRLLAKDDDEAEELFDEYAHEHTLSEACGEVIVPALENAKRDRMRGLIDLEQERFILEAVEEHLEEAPIAAGKAAGSDAAEGEDAPPLPKPDRDRLPLVLGYGVRDEVDQAAVGVLAALLTDAPCRFEPLSRNLLLSEVIAAVRERKPAGLCLIAIPPGGITHTRGLVKRLRFASPGLKIVVGRWSKTLTEKSRAALREQGANYLGRTPEETRECVISVARLKPADAETKPEPVPA